MDINEKKLDDWITSYPKSWDSEGEVVYECEVCGSDIEEGHTTYWFDIKGISHLRFCSSSCAIQYAFEHNINPMYVNEKIADAIELGVLMRNIDEEEKYYPTTKESWE